MDKVQFFLPSQGYLQKIAALFENHRAKILHLVPTAQVEHIGATSVPNLLTKGDLDLQVSVALQKFNKAIVLLQTEYCVHQLENWTKSYASFKVEEGSDIPVGIQSEKVEELNQLKRFHEGRDMDVYINRKGEFFTKLLENNT